MPQPRRGWGNRHGKKAGTKNKTQAAARDERAARAEAADRAAAAELLADLATQEEPHIASPATVAKPSVAVSGQQARRRAIIIWWYVELGCPQKKHWDGRGGTVATIASKLEMHEGADHRPIHQVLSRYVDNEQQVKSRARRAAGGSAAACRRRAAIAPTWTGERAATAWAATVRRVP